MAYSRPPPRVDQHGQSNTTFYELTSVNQRFRFTLQPDRNIVLYSDGRPIWSSNTQKPDTSDGPYTLKLQADGNLCGYNWQDQCFWASHTQGRGVGPYSLSLLDDGNCVMYDARGSAIWTTNTSQAPPPGPPSHYPPPGWQQPPGWQPPPSAPPAPAPWQPPVQPPAPPRRPHRVDQHGGHNVDFPELLSEDGRFHFIMQTDRNVVLYKHRDAIWSSNTYTTDTRDGPYRLTLQADGNLCGYTARGQCFWASNTCHKGSGPFSLVMQNDGNCVLYDSRRQPTWSTDTWKHA